MRCLFSLIILATTISAITINDVNVSKTHNYEHMFDRWVTKHGKEYLHYEVEKAFEAFKDNVDFVTKHNEEYNLGLHSYKVGLGKFADLSLDDFKNLHLGYNSHNVQKRSNHTVWLNGSVPDSVDWRKKGAVTPVKNQGQCGSCWAFSTTGSLEGATFLKTGKLVSLSEQELVDCDDNGDQGCNGGLMDNAFDWIEDNGGLDAESDYPYKAHKSFGGCNKKKESKHIAKVSGHSDVPVKNEDQLKLAVAKQPVSVAIEADQSGFQLYESGVFTGTCGTQLDHGVLAVGYGTDDSGQDYWIVKNSWGESWGKEGYILLARNVKSHSGQCGITLSASYPSV